MPNVPLPPELISLVHHIELNKANWWDKAIQQLLITAIWLSGNNLTLPEILNNLRTTFQVNIDNYKAKKQLDILCSKGVLVCMPEEQFRISETFLKKCEKDFREAGEIESDVVSLFVNLINQSCPSLDAKETWYRFNDQFLIPLIREVGANTYKLLSEKSFHLNPARLDRFLQQYPPEIHASFSDAIETFLDPKNSQVRSYILRSLNAYFFIEASSLREDSLEALIRFTGSNPTFMIFVDTNFLFALLDLTTPSEEIGQSLIKLTKQLSNKVNVKLYILPTTIDEARRKLIMTKQSLSGLRVVPNLAEAALEMNLDGIHLKFFEESRKRGLSSPEDYFEPYISDLKSIIRSKGVELFNENVDSYKTRQDVIDDIMTQLKVEQKRYKERAKNYERLEHDMVLWHFVQDMRSIQIESPLEAKYWLVTLDYRMLGFDKFKKRMAKKSNTQNYIPISLYPTTIIQMLQFWVPRTTEFEEAMLNCMRMPFLYQEFDPKAEKVTLDILQALGRYENVGDLPTETISAILVNNALRQKLSVEQEVDKKARLVKEALVEQHQQAKRQLKEVSRKLLAKEQELAEESRNRQAKEFQLAEEFRERQAKERQLAEEHRDKELLQARIRELEATSHAEKEALANRITQLEQSSLAKDQRREIEKHRLLFALKWVIGPLFFILLVGIGTYLLISRLINPRFWWVAITICSVSLMVWAHLTDRSGSKDSNIMNWRFFNAFHKSKKWFFGLLWLLLSGVLVNFLYDLIKGK
ncbi:MAG: cell envelope integrity protein TolA [Thermoproteota archaeon]|nr:cell envelope integrity protein TolA [Thermoproteota archaeon]